MATPELTENVIVAYAQKFNTHPAMIIGRLQHKKVIDYATGRQFMIPVNLETVPAT